MSLVSCPLAPRSVIRLGGPDRHAFLQGLVSNDVHLVTRDTAIYAALLTPQGKFLHDLFIIESGDAFLIDCEAARAEDLLKRLAAYKLRAKVNLEDAVNDFEIRAIWDSSSPRKRGSIERDSAHINRREDIIVFNDPRLPELGQRIIVKKGTAISNIPATDFPAYDHHRLALGVADGSRDMIVEKSTLTDGNFDLLNGISWTKGCYVGQELTARMHYRALVKKRMFPVRIEGAAPSFGATITLNGEEIGDMRSSAGEVGIALLSVEKMKDVTESNALLLSGASRLTAGKPNWMETRESGDVA